MTAILIVRLGSLGDIVHALPAVSAIRSAFPAARLDWIVDATHREVLRLVDGIDTVWVWRAGGWRDAAATLAAIRRVRYDAVVDLQGLLKSAVLARLAGARRIVGFGARTLREPAARLLYRETADAVDVPHVLDKNLVLAAALGAVDARRRFPIDVPDSPVVQAARAACGAAVGGPFAVLNPGAAWPNKRWPTASFGALARHLSDRHRLPSLVAWGPGEEALAGAVADASGGAACPAPPTDVTELVSLLDAASIVVAGDTGPLHLAAALGTPVVALMGPTDPARNGPWTDEDGVVSRFDECRCRYERRCTASRWCLDAITVESVARAVDERLASVARRGDG